MQARHLDPQTNLSCSICKGKFPATVDFFRIRQRKSGLVANSSCRNCERKAANSYRKKKLSEGYTYWDNGGKERHFKKVYKLSLSDREELFKNHNNKCAVCKVTHVSTHNDKNYLCVDHDHKTGKIRGLLCCRCNRGLGYFDDNISRLEKLIEYLKT